MQKCSCNVAARSLITQNPSEIEGQSTLVSINFPLENDEANQQRAKNIFINVGMLYAQRYNEIPS